MWIYQGICGIAPAITSAIAANARITDHQSRESFIKTCKSI